MARNVYYEAPDLLASAATYASGRKQRRANIKDTIANQLTVDQANAKNQLTADEMTARARSSDAMIAQRDREAAMQGEAARVDDARMAQVAEANQRNAEEAQRNNARNREHDFVQAGLKSGQLYYTPQAKQELATIANQITKVQTQDDIDPDIRNQMLDTLLERKQRIELSPAMRSEPPPPTPSEEFRSSTAYYSPNTKQIYEHGDEGIPPDAILGGKNRSGQWVPFKEPIKKDDSPAAFYSKTENVVGRRGKIDEYLTKRAEAQHSADMKVWEHEINTLKIAVTADDKDSADAKEKLDKKLASPPTIKFPTPDEVEAELRREMLSSGVVDESDPQQALANAIPVRSQDVDAAASQAEPGTILVDENGVYYEVE